MQSLTNAENSSSQIKNIGLSLIFLFAFSRPLSLLDVKIPYLLELYGILFSYAFLLILLIDIRSLKITRTIFAVIFFISYCTMSLSWGSKFNDFAELLVPFLLFFSTVLFIRGKNQIKQFLFVYNIGFIIPLLASTVLIILGLRIQFVEYHNNLPRHCGIYSGSHTLAYQMLFYSYIYCMYISFTEKLKTNMNVLINNWSFKIQSVLLILSVYCLYQSHTRTTMIGFLIFWSIFLWGYNRKCFYLFCILSLLISILFSANIKSIIFKKDQIDIDTATSGRTEMWSDNILLYKEFSMPEKLLGKGLGWQKPGLQFHNDYLKLLMNLGIIGLFGYLFIIVNLLYDIYLIKDKYKYIFWAILLSVSVMNFGSNVAISRVELHQLFWITMGFVPLFKRREINE